MSTLVTSDLHFDSNQQNADRWNLFPWLKTQIKSLKIKQLLLLGDITNEKDRHEASLVNRLVDKLYELSQLAEVFVLTGNHDFINPKQPFFAFMRNISNIHFIIEPEEYLIENKPALFLPCTRNYEKDWEECDFNEVKYIFTHQTYEGSIVENGIKLLGISPSVFAHSKAKVFSGDVHVAQKINKQIEYVGSPYHIRFGDNFKARVLMIGSTNSGEHQQQDIYFPFRRREVITMRNMEDLKAAEFDLGTQVKIKVHLKRSEYPDWPSIRKSIQALSDRRGWELCGLKLEALKVKDRTVEETGEEVVLTPENILNQYAHRKKLDKDMVKVGKEFIKEANR